MIKINEIYPDLINKFPAEIDPNRIFRDVDAETKPLVDKFYSFISSGNFDGATKLRAENPVLDDMILDRRNYQYLYDMNISTQRFYMNDIQQYLVNIVKFKDEYNPASKYTKYDVVIYLVDDAYETFMAIKTDVPIGTLPIDTDYWVAITLRGKEGVSGTGLAWKGSWNKDKKYLLDDCVSYNNVMWACIQNNINHVPNDVSDYWERAMSYTKQSVLSATEPIGQDTGDVWLKDKYIYNPDDTYQQAWFETKAELVKCKDGADLQSKLDQNIGINATATHSGTVLAITAPPDAVQIIFIAPSNFSESDTYTLNGTAITITDLNLEPLSDAWKQGSPIPLTIKGDKAFFKGGGSTYGTLSPQVKNFTAKAGNHEIKLSWTNPSDSNHAGTYIVRKQGSAPQKLSDGVKIDVGKATSYTDNEPENDKLYYYRAFTYNAKKQVQTELTRAVVSGTPTAYKIMTVKINLNESNPAAMCTYADDAVGMTVGSQEWDEFFGHKPCLFKDGAVVGYLNPNDFTKFEDGASADITTGAAGDVMIEFPRHGLKISTENDIVTVSMTEAQDNVEFEYLAHTRGTTRKDKFYVGAYLAYNAGTSIKSIINKIPSDGLTMADWRNRASQMTNGYDMFAFYQLTYLQAMYILKYKNLSSQTAIGRGYVDGNSSAILTGGTETKGMDWGETTGTQHMKLFGIEDFWGNLSVLIDGLLIDANYNILTNTDNYNNTGSGYSNWGKGATATSGGYLKKPTGSAETGLIPKEFSGSSTTYFCDDAYINSNCGMIYGGMWSFGSRAGIFGMYVNNPVDNTQPYVGARLMYL